MFALQRKIYSSILYDKFAEFSFLLLELNRKQWNIKGIIMEFRFHLTKYGACLLWALDDECVKWRTPFIDEVNVHVQLISRKGQISNTIYHYFDARKQGTSVMNAILI